MSESSSNAPVDTTDLVKDSKNAFPLVCENCSSKIMGAGVGTFEETEHELPCVLQKKQEENSTEQAELKMETFTQYYRVEDKFDFDNAGFTKTVDTKVKYLCCVDCSLGPFGWHDTDTQKSYVALARVKHNK